MGVDAVRSHHRGQQGCVGEAADTDGCGETRTGGERWSEGAARGVEQS